MKKATYFRPSLTLLLLSLALSTQAATVTWFSLPQTNALDTNALVQIAVPSGASYVTRLTTFSNMANAARSGMQPSSATLTAWSLQSTNALAQGYYAARRATDWRPRGWNLYTYWNSLYYYETNVWQYLVPYSNTNGLTAAGFNFFEMDDYWFNITTTRDANGFVQPDTSRFPNLTNFVSNMHTQGWKVGIYWFGPNWHGGANDLNYPRQDARQVAGANFDYIKFDGMGGCTNADWLAQFCAEIDAIYLTAGRKPIHVFVHGDWPHDTYNVWMRDPRIYNLANSLWVSGDPYNLWYQVLHQYDMHRDMYINGITPRSGVMEFHSNVAADNLTVFAADFNCNALIAATPSLDALTITHDPLNATDRARINIATNREVLAVCEDAGRIVGWPVWTNGTVQAWVRPLGTLTGPEWCVGLWNIASNVNTTTGATFNFTNLSPASAVYSVRDLVAHQAFGATNSFTVTIDPQELKLYRLSPVKDAPGISVAITNGATIFYYTNGILFATGTTNRSPADLAGLVAWYKADSLTGSDGSSVSTWPDSSGNGRDLTMTYAGSQPVFSNSVLGGLPALTFVSKSLTNQSILVSTESNLTVYGVVKMRTNTANSRIAGCTYAANDFDGDGNGGIFGYMAGTNMGDYRGVGLNATLMPTNQPVFWATTYDANNQTNYLNSVLTNTALPVNGKGSWKWKILAVGSGVGSGAPNYYFNGQIMELMIYTNNHGATERNYIGGYLSNKWGL